MMRARPDTERRAACLIFFLSAQAASAFANPLAEPHLPVIPRTPEEAAQVHAATATPADFDAPQPHERRSAGAATARVTPDANAFSLPSANMGFERQLDFHVGNGLFRKLWVSAPASTRASDGLGPLYNARSCQRCHLKDGRGHPPAGAADAATSLLLRISIPGRIKGPAARIRGYHAAAPDPVYGRQLQDFAVAGVPAEYRLHVDYAEFEVPLAGGEVARLRRPAYRATALAYGPLHAQAMLSPRVAPPMIGLGLLEAIPAADILARADPNDADGDGISGRPNIVWSAEYARPMLGRFGHKATAATVRAQAARAFADDIGISSPLHPDAFGECTERQSACRNAPHGDGDARRFEIDAESLDFVTFYSRNLAVPARRGAGDPEVLRGKEIFHRAGCAGCHAPAHVTHRLNGRPEQSFQLIWPYTDLLLHDMGPGLADRRPEARASGAEWRTPPLWGIGLTRQVSGHTFFLHDGRARSLLEAVLWHGGEAQAARDAAAAMAPAERAALLRFLESL